MRTRLRTTPLKLRRCLLKGLFTCLSIGMITGGSAALAQENYPSRPIRLVIPFAPGTSIDILGRLLAQNLEPELGQPVVVDNRAGASGIIGAELTAKAAPDGYTLMLGSSSIFSLNPVTFAKLPYDPIKSFTPITRVGVQPMVVVVSNKVPARTLDELLALARAKPDSLNSATLGSFHELVLAHFAAVTRARIVNVPYKSSPIPALIAGEVDMMIDVASLALPQAKNGQVRALAITSGRRSPLVPELPTVAELGYPGFQAETWTALVGPPGMPRPVVERIGRAMTKVMASPAVVERLSALAITLDPNTPDQLASFFQSELNAWQKVARDAGMKAQ